MKYSSAILIPCLALAALAATPDLSAQTKAAAPAEKPPAPAQESGPVLAVPSGYRYEAHGRRDPFVNPVPKPPPAATAAVEAEPKRPPGMKGALLDEVSVLGVFISKDDSAMTRAILQIPGMKAPALVVRGDVLWDAVIKEIRPDSVVFTRVAPPNKPRNPSEETEVVRKLRSTAGDKK